MSSLTIITGCPGTGKTTVSKQIARSFDKGVYIEGDAFFRFIDNPIPPTEPESHDQNRTVLGATFTAAKVYLAGGYDVVVDGIFGPWFLKEVAQDLLAEPSALIASPTYIILTAEEDETLHRATTRPDADKFAVEGVRQMYQAFERGSVYDGHKLATSGQSVSATVKEVANAVAEGTHQLDLHTVVNG